MNNKEDYWRPMSRALIAILAAFSLVACGNGSQQPTGKKAQHDGAPQAPKTPPVLTAQVSLSPLFESGQGWGVGYAKAKAQGEGRGVVVGPGTDNSNVFAQQFSVRPDEPFKIIARASSVGKPKAMGRFQINWLDADSKFISTSIQPFEVAQEEKTFEAYVTAPPGATTGTLYVVPAGKEDVVRYTEMKVLGESARAKPGTVPETKAIVPVSPPVSQGAPLAKAVAASNSFPKPPNLTPLDGSGRSLTVAESQYYFYHAAKAMQRRAKERGMDFIMYVMPDYNISRLMPAINQLRAEGIKVLAYEPQGNWKSGVDESWYWQKADSHWTEAAVRLTADEILGMWKTQAVANRPFSAELQAAYSNGFPQKTPQ
ncbi:MAG: hypothetical protein EPN14_01375 [Gallionella sp.]|nr:MAG: hypothetical protein EPN14_01375 [Gallionella sp.]